MRLLKFRFSNLFLCVSVLFTIGLFEVQPTLALNSQNNKSGEVVNLALSATVTTSFVSSWETLGAVNNGDEPTSSTQDDGTTYGNWNGEDSYNSWNWVQYDWEQLNSLTSTSVYWWSDGGGISQPYSAYVDYWDGSEWVLLDSIGKNLNKYNTIQIDNLKTNKLRIHMISLTCTGILQWKVMGIEGKPCNPTPITAKYKINDGDWNVAKYITVNKGDKLYLGAFPADSGLYTWDGPSGYSATGSQVSVNDIQINQGGTYTASLVNNCWATSSAGITATVVDPDKLGDAYTWPSYTPTLAYNFRQEYPTLQMPTKDLPDCNEVVGAQSDGWWTFLWGPNKNSKVTPDAITPLLERMNQDFAYFRDTLGWPPRQACQRGLPQCNLSLWFRIMHR